MSSLKLSTVHYKNFTLYQKKKKKELSTLWSLVHYDSTHMEDALEAEKETEAWARDLKHSILCSLQSWYYNLYQATGRKPGAGEINVPIYRAGSGSTKAHV